MWLYGSGFPKSMAIDKALESKLVNNSANKKDFKNLDGTKVEAGNWGISRMSYEQGFRASDYTADKHLRIDKVNYQTEEGKKWQGWGTCLKPAFEPIIVARKPFKGSLVDNVLKWGVGGLNIDECRVGNEVIKGGTTPNFRDVGRKSKETIGIDKLSFGQVENAERIPLKDHTGRFPANLILTYNQLTFDDVCGGFPINKSTLGPAYYKGNYTKNGWKNTSKQNTSEVIYNDSGSASRYFMNCKYTGKDEDFRRYIYTPKASKKDRDEGLDEFEEDKVNDGRITPIDNLFQRGETPRKNTHPTVKPTELMQYLIRLVTPNGGVILDPFMGSGSTGKAVVYENRERNKNYDFIGIEKEEEYYNIAKARIENI